MLANDIDKQLEQISAYVRFAEDLPIELSAVKVYLGYDASGEPVLSPDAMQRLFEQIREHADLWNEIAAQASKQIRELSITAASVVEDGTGLLRGLKALGPVGQILNTVGKSSIGPGDFEASTAALDADTVARLNRLGPYVDALQSTTLDSLGDTDATTKLIADFRNKAALLEAGVAGKVEKLKSGQVDVIGKEETVGPVIDAFRQACDRIVAQVGEGSEIAAAVRQQVDKTLAELTSREPDLQEQQRLTYAVGRLFVHLRSLGYSMLDAQTELTHLWFASSGAHSNLAAAASDLGQITTQETLLGFYVSYDQILREWTSIRDDASVLYKSFE